MKILDIPVAKDASDVELGVRATDSLYIPGFLIPPQVTNELRDGLGIEDLARSLSPKDSPRVDEDLVDDLRPILEEVFSLDLSDFFGSSAIQHRTVAVQGGNSHTDSLYEGGGLWLCGETYKGKPRSLSFATVFTPISPVNMSLESAVPKSTECIFKGSANLGWMAYFLAKSRTGDEFFRARTAHMVGGEGVWARFGEHDEQGIACKKAQFMRESFTR